MIADPAKGHVYSGVLAWVGEKEPGLLSSRSLQEILAAQRPMTARQAYYQLVSRQVIENTRSACQAVSSTLVAMRQEGAIPWEWIEDRLRQPRSVSMWNGLSDFAETVMQAYRRDVWEDQGVCGR